jgi:ribosome maturation factor RimP
MELEWIKEKITQLVKPQCQLSGLSLWGIEFAPGAGKKRGLLRIYVDAPQGVNVDQCARLSRELSVILDVEDIIPGPYNLEISSPGLDRIFFSPEQLTGYIGQKLKVKLTNPIDRRKNFSGTLQEVKGSTFTIISDSGEKWQFDFVDTQKVQLKFEFKN